MKVIIFYGTDCNEQTAWIPWLKSNLNDLNINCIIPNLPTPENQTYKEWSKIVDKIKIETNDIIIGWSTGAIFAVRYLYENKIKVNKLLLISGFNNYIGNVPFVDNINKDFFMKDIKNAKAVASQITCFKSENDPFITQDALTSFASELDAKVVNIIGGGHFNSSAGYDSFKELLEEIKY